MHRKCTVTVWLFGYVSLTKKKIFFVDTVIGWLKATCMRTPLAIIFTVITVTLVTQLRTTGATVVLHDTFEDGNRTKSGPLDTNWWTSSSAGSLSVLFDSTFGSNALSYSDGTGFRGFVGDFPSITLGATGDYVLLEFTFRYVNTPPNQNSGIRFGLYNGTVSTSDGPSDPQLHTSGDYTGYYMNVSVGTATNQQLFQEFGTAGGIMAGTDRTQIGTTNTSTDAGLNNTLPHTGLFCIERTATGLSFLGQIDSVTLINEVQTSGTFQYTFNNTGFNIANSFTGEPLRFDEVKVTFVPEPSTYALLGLGLAGVVWLRRRSKKTACAPRI
jgi:hypothetical protein